MKIVAIPNEKYYLDIYEFYQIMGVFKNHVVGFYKIYFAAFDDIRIGLAYRVFFEIPL